MSHAGLIQRTRLNPGLKGTFNTPHHHLLRTNKDCGDLTRGSGLHARCTPGLIDKSTYETRPAGRLDDPRQNWTFSHNSDITARVTATVTGWSAARTVTTLMICPAICALMMLTALADAACPAWPRRRTRPDRIGKLVVSLSAIPLTIKCQSCSKAE